MTYVCPDGPINPELILVGEAPGQEEVAQGLGFVGPSGQVLWTFMDYTGLPPRPACWVTNLFKEPCKPEKVEPELYALAISELKDELRSIDCKTIVTLGAWSTKALLSHVPRLSMYWCHGMTFTWKGRTVIPSYHPAAGMHEPSAFGLCQWDLARVADHLRGVPSIVKPGPPLKGIEACDTEGSLDRPYCTTSAYRERGQIRPRIWSKRSTFQREIGVFHAANGDLAMLSAMGQQWPAQIGDSMILAHILQTEPLGLKDLARRWVGHEGVVEYEDLVVPHLQARALAIDEKRTKVAMRRSKGKVDALQAICGPPEYDEIEGFKEYALSDSVHTLLVYEALAERCREEGIRV